MFISRIRKYGFVTMRMPMQEVESLMFYEQRKGISSQSNGAIRRIGANWERGFWFCSSCEA